MDVLIHLVLVIAVFALMEGAAWSMHKYVQHGFLWKWHQDHHQVNEGFFEKNDRFFLVFAIPSASLIMLGINYSWLLFDIGLGILLYGIAYFIIHDVFIHRRFKWLKQIDHPYFKGLRKAHKVHHKHTGKEDGECFGMLLVPFKYYRQFKK